MTTYILPGFTFTVDDDLPDDENATSVAPTETRVVFNQGVAPELTYTIKESFDDSSPLVNITSEEIDVRFDGVSANVDDQFDQDGEDEIGRLVWDGGDKVTDYLLTGIENTLYVLRLGGDPFPDFGTDVDAFHAFTRSVTDSGQARADHRE